MYKLVESFYCFELWEGGEGYLVVVYQGQDPSIGKNCVDSLTTVGTLERKEAIKTLTWFVLTAHLNKCWQAKVVYS